MFTHLITHRDLDGAACAIVASYMWHGNLQIIHVDYDSLDDVLALYVRKINADPNCQIWCTDISPSQSFFDKVRSGEIVLPIDRFVVVDHHASGAYADPANRELVPGVFDSSTCGAKLLYNRIGARDRLLTEGDDIVPPLRAAIEEFLDLVDRWDRWIFSDKNLRDRAEDMQRWYDFSRFDEFVVSRLAAGSHIHLLNAREQFVVGRLRDQEEGYIRACVKAAVRSADSKGRWFRWTIASREASKIGHELARGVHYAAVYLPEHNKVELRSGEDGVDVGAIAKARGGGGHVHAAGYPAARCPFPEPSDWLPGVDDRERRLRDLEALLFDAEWENHDVYMVCPWCGAHQADGHVPDCRAAKLLGWRRRERG